MRTNTRKRNQRVAQRRSTKEGGGGSQELRTNKRSRVMKGVSLRREEGQEKQ